MPIEGVGVPQLERLVSPFPPHSTLLFLNDPGIEAEPFLYQAAHHQLARGGEVVYAVTNRAPGSVLAAMAGFGLDVHDHRARLSFVDAFSPLMGVVSTHDQVVAQPATAEAFIAQIERLARERPRAWLLIDSLSTLLDQDSEGRFLAQYPRLVAAMRGFELTEALFTKWPYGDDVAPFLSAFDAVVGVRGVEDRVTTGQYFVVERAAWRPSLEARPWLFKALKPGGVHVYIPKVLVTGPYNAGKSSFVQNVSDSAVSVDQLGTTVALDHGRVTMDGLTTDVFGTPGQARFDPLLTLLAGQALGVIVVVDATKPDSFPRAREMLLQTWKQGLPCIIAANKQDLPDALPPADVERLLNPPARVKVVPCSGQDVASARRVLKELMDQILLQPSEVAP